MPIRPALVLLSTAAPGVCEPIGRRWQVPAIFLRPPCPVRPAFPVLPHDSMRGGPMRVRQRLTRGHLRRTSEAPGRVFHRSRPRAARTRGLPMRKTTKLLFTAAPAALALSLAMPAHADPTPECNSGSALNATECGINAEADGEDSTAVGANTAPRQQSTSIGSGALSGFNSVATGYNSLAFLNAVAIGAGAGAGNQGTAIGTNARATGNLNATAVGTGAQAISENATSLGAIASAEGENATAIGFNTKTRQQSTSVGANALSGFNSVATGYDSLAFLNAVAVGSGAGAGNQGTALGTNA